MYPEFFLFILRIRKDSGKVEDSYNFLNLLSMHRSSNPRPSRLVLLCKYLRKLKQKSLQNKNSNLQIFFYFEIHKKDLDHVSTQKGSKLTNQAVKKYEKI